MQRVRVGIIGAGGIAQIEHVPNLLRLKHQFEILGVYDPSLTVRAFLTRKFELPVFENIETLLALPLDAVVIASPDALHHEQILAAFALGLHVFCEKPLCYSVADIDDVIAARDVARKVLQVGYMKRFDPSYQAALACLPGTAENLRYISIEVNDPDAWPFIRHHDWCRGEDVPAEAIKNLQAKQRAQVARAVKGRLDATSYRGFVGAYCSALVHDVNGEQVGAVDDVADGLAGRDHAGPIRDARHAHGTFEVVALAATIERFLHAGRTVVSHRAVIGHEHDECVILDAEFL